MDEEVHIHELVEEDYEVYCTGCDVHGYVVISDGSMIPIRVPKKGKPNV